MRNEFNIYCDEFYPDLLDSAYSNFDFMVIGGNGVALTA